MTSKILISSLMFFAFFCLPGCAKYPPIGTVAEVDLQRFMGTWYVIANIPTPIEKAAHNAVEHYRLNPDGSIATTFSFNKGAFDGPKRTFHPTGYVLDTDSNAVWGMQFIWPIKADYRVLYLNRDYSQTVIGRKKRDYAWIMAREPEIPDEDYQSLIRLLAERGYDSSKIRRVPQQWR